MTRRPLRFWSARKRERHTFLSIRGDGMSVLSLGSTKAEFDAFLNDTYGIANDELTVKQGKVGSYQCRRCVGRPGCAAWRCALLPVTQGRGEADDSADKLGVVELK